MPYGKPVDMPPTKRRAPGTDRPQRPPRVPRTSPPLVPASRAPRVGSRRRARVARGTLQRDDILVAALDLVRREPERALTMERVAAELGTRPMSLYTHVRSRGDLIDGAFRHALRDWRLRESEGPWDEAIRIGCHALRDAMLPYAPLVRELSRPGRLHPAFLECAATFSAVLRRAGFEGREHARAVRWIPQTILGAVLLEAGRPSHLRGAADESAGIAGALGSVSEGTRSELVALLPYLDRLEEDDLFAYTVERMIEGLRAVLASGANGAARAGPSTTARRRPPRR